MRERDVMTESEVGEMQLLALKMEEAMSQGMWAASKSKGTGCPLEPPEGTQPCLTP